MHVSLELPGTVSLQSDDLNLLVSRHDAHTRVFRPDWYGTDNAWILSLSQREESVDNSSRCDILPFSDTNLE